MKTREMKRLSIFGMAALVAAAVSCKKSGDDAEPLPAQGVFHAVAEAQAGDSKTEINSSRDVLWTAGDKIRVFNGSHTPGDFTLTSGGGSSHGDFAESGGLQHGFYDLNYTAFYPETTSYNEEKDYYTLNLTDSQAYAENTFSPSANPMAAKSTTTSLSFQNLCGTLMLELGNNTKQGLKVQAIRVVTRKAGESLSGPAKVTSGGSGVTLEMLSGNGGKNYVDLDCTANGTTDGVDIGDGDKKFYIVLPNGTLTEGFDVEVKLKKGNDTHYYRKGVGGVMDNSIHTAQVRVMPKLDITIGFVVNDSGKTVKFAKGNLYYVPSTHTEDGKAICGIEEHPWKYNTISSTNEEGNPITFWDESHISHFYWTDNITNAAAQSIISISAPFFTEKLKEFNINGTTYHTLFKDEWEYVLNLRHTEFYSWAKVYMHPTSGTGVPTKVAGLLLFPAEWTEPTTSSYTRFSDNAFNANKPWEDNNFVDEGDLDKDRPYEECVFLPCAGYRSSNDTGIKIIDDGMNGYYLSSSSSLSPSSTSIEWDMYLKDNLVATSYHYKIHAFAMHMVTYYQEN